RRRAPPTKLLGKTIRTGIAKDRAIYFMEEITMNTVDRIIAISRGEKPKEESRRSDSSSRRHQFNVQTAAVLRTKTFAPLKYIVPGLIVEGLVLLAGKPKVRKSWMALDIGLATARSQASTRCCSISRAGGWRAASATAL